MNACYWIDVARLIRCVKLHKDELAIRFQFRNILSQEVLCNTEGSERISLLSCFHGISDGHLADCKFQTTNKLLNALNNTREPWSQEPCGGCKHEVTLECCFQGVCPGVDVKVCGGFNTPMVAYGCCHRSDISFFYNQFMQQQHRTWILASLICRYFPFGID